MIAWSERQQRAQRIPNLAPGEQLVAAPSSSRRAPIAPEGPALTLKFLKDGIRLGLHTLLATPLDFGAERLSLEFLLPAGAGDTTTLESKTNFLKAVPSGETVTAICRPVHRGARTMVWTREIRRADGKRAAVVTQTQMVL